MGAAAGGIKAGNAFVVIDAIDKTGKVLENVRNSFRKIGNDLAETGRGLAARAALALAPTVIAGKVFMDFDDSMRRVESRAEGTADEMRALRDQAKQLGAATAFSAGQIGMLQARLADRKYNRSEIFKMTPSIMHLARAVGAGKDLTNDAVQAADLVTGTMKAFQLEATDAVTVSDKMTVALKSSSYGLEDMATALQYFATSAHTYNEGLDETISAITTLSDLNMEASVTGTSLRNMLTYLSNAAERSKFNEKLSDMTGKTIDFTKVVGQGKADLNSLPKILFSISKAAENLGTADMGDLMHQLFGTRAEVPAIALGKMADKFEIMMGRLSAARGQAEETSKTLEAGIGGLYRESVSVIEDMGIALIEALQGPIFKIGTALQNMGRQFNEWMRENRGMVVAVVGAIAVMGLYGVAVYAIGTAFSFVSGIFGFFMAVSNNVVFTLRYIITVLMAIPGAITAFAVGIWNAVAAMIGFTVSIYNAVAALVVFTATAIADAVVVLAGLAAELVALVGPIMAVVAVLIVIGSVFVIAMEAIEKGTDVLGAALAAFQDFAAALKADILGTFNWIGMYVRDWAGRMQGTMSEVGKGLFAALELGDLQSAWKVAALGMKITWMTLIHELKSMWEDFELVLLGTFPELMKQLNAMVVKIKMVASAVDVMAQIWRAKAAAEAPKVPVGPDGAPVPGAVAPKPADLFGQKYLESQQNRKARSQELEDLNKQLAELAAALDKNSKEQRRGSYADLHYAPPNQALLEYLINDATGVAKPTPLNVGVEYGTMEYAKAAAENAMNFEKLMSQGRAEELATLKGIENKATKLQRIDENIQKIADMEGV